MRSHAIVHDAVIIHECIPSGLVFDAFRKAALINSFPVLKLEIKDWGEDLGKARTLLNQYKHDAKSVHSSPSNLFGGELLDRHLIVLMMCISNVPVRSLTHLFLLKSLERGYSLFA